MILRSISVQGFGCFADQVHVGPFCDGVNLLYAPNGTGKSTLLRAFNMALVDSYRVKSSELQEWQPWGRGLSPTISVEFEHGNRAYRLEKTFLKGASSLLYRNEGGAWKRYMQEEDADEFLRHDILNCTPPGSGIAKQKHWGLAQILWTTQGDLALPQLSDNVVDAIQQSVGATLTSSGSKIESTLQELYAEFYTPTGKLKKNAALNTFQREHDRLVADLETAEKELAEFERMSEEIEDFRTRVELTQSKCRALNDERTEAARLLDRYRVLQAARSQQEERRAARQAVYANIKQTAEAIITTRAKITAERAAVTTLGHTVPERRQLVETCTISAYKAQELFAEANRMQREALKSATVAQLSREYVQTKLQFGQVSTATAEIAAVDLMLAEMTTRKCKLTAPSPKDLARARELVALEQQLTIQLELARVTVEIDPVADSSIVVTQGECLGTIELRAGHQATLTGSPNIAFDIPGFAQLRVRGPVTNYATVRDERENCRRELGTFDDAFGTHDLDRLQAFRNEYDAVERSIGEQNAKRSGLLGNEMLDQLCTRRDRLLIRLSEIEEAHQEWKEASPDPDLLERESKQAQDDAANSTKNADTACKKSEKDLNAAIKDLTAAETEFETRQANLGNLESDLHKLTSDGKSDEQRQADLETASLEYDAARIALERIDEEMRQLGNDPSSRLAVIDNQLGAADRDLKKLETSLIQAETRVTSVAATSPYDRVASLKESRSTAAAVLDRERRRMEAIKLLSSVLVESKAALLKDVALPVQKRLNEFLSQVCKTPFGEIRMDGSFTDLEVVPQALVSSGATVGIDRLSGGEKEQLHLCTRLALANELAQQERQLLVFDDVLTFTDDVRLNRICELLSRASEKLQIMILTCHPERFIGIQNAKRFDLQAVIESQQTRSDQYAAR